MAKGINSVIVATVLAWAAGSPSAAGTISGQPRIVDGDTVQIGEIVVLALTTPAALAADWTPDQIATLPLSVVKAIQQKCAQQYPADYSVRVVCEDTEYDAF